MVTRVDKKPIIYGTTMLRVWKHAAVCERKSTLSRLLGISAGYKIPKVSARDILEDMEDIDYVYRYTGIDDSMAAAWHMDECDYDDDSLRLARSMMLRDTTFRTRVKHEQFSEEICNLQDVMIRDVDRVYYGTEAVYQFYTKCISDQIFTNKTPLHYEKWVKQVNEEICLLQGPYLFIHPTAVQRLTADMKIDYNYIVQAAWRLFKQVETLSLRLGSPKNLLAHAHYSGFSRKMFEPSECPLDDFEIPLSGFTECSPNVRMFNLAGVRYYKVGTSLYCLSNDDCINLATMAQCYYKVTCYFMAGNGYTVRKAMQAQELLCDIARHACQRIDSKLNYSNIIRSIHILAQGSFNDIFEETQGTDLGWKERSENYFREADELDPMGKVFYNRAKALATDRIDELNVGFIYHAFIGDEMLMSDLHSKVATMKTKVLDADQGEWSMFIRFCKAYMLCRYMKTHKRIPKYGGDGSLLQKDWAKKCISGRFAMPPQSEWGNVWIQGEFNWTEFANIWHFECQDVSYVTRDSKGLKDGKYRDRRDMASELLMALTCGDVLDTLTGSTPSSARKRIQRGDSISEVVLTSAPKAENAKPSNKKRVTFAADCEFRKLQSEYDRNCRKVMSFVRGPSLGVDQCALERQFSQICQATTLGTAGAVCSHDISAWSESMDRARKFEFEKVLIDMLNQPDMINIKNDWQSINATVLKQGSKDIVALDNGSFQGFDGSSSTILHSMILIYCIDTAFRNGTIETGVKANMATLIDDCVALMEGLSNREKANNFWAHLKTTYRKLGFEVDELKSIFSTIKAIYLSRRFALGGEIPADFKVFIKSHISYEDPLRCSMDIVSDLFGANRGAADANGDAWFIYQITTINVLSELAHYHPNLTALPPDAAAVFALAPNSENGWGFPSIIDWSTNDVVDKRCHFNAIMEAVATHKQTSAEFQHGVDIYRRPAAQALKALKEQPWRTVSYSNIFTNPFEAVREGPLKPDMLRRNAVADMLNDLAIANPWKSLLKWNNSKTTNRVRELLINSGSLHAPTLAALVNCMPDNYRLSLIGKAIGSSAVLDMLPRGQRATLKRRVMRCASSFFDYSLSLYQSCRTAYSAEDLGSVTFVERTNFEREEFYAYNGVQMCDHTFPDPVGTFTRASFSSGSVLAPNTSGLIKWDKSSRVVKRMSQLISPRGIYTPQRSGRVWEITSEYAKGWDSVSQRIAMGLAILARAKADGHGVNGLLSYFTKAWNENSNISPEDTHLIAIHGSIKRLDANPGSSSHPIIISRNLLRGFHNRLDTAINAIKTYCKRVTGSDSNLHDPLAHSTSMLAITALQYTVFQYLGITDNTLTYDISTRPGCIIAESQTKMTTDRVASIVELEIMDSAEDYGLLQSCPELAKSIIIPTMKYSWVTMINCLVTGDFRACEEMIEEIHRASPEDILHKYEEKEAEYSVSVVLAEAPARRGGTQLSGTEKFAVRSTPQDPRFEGDAYTSSVRTMGSKYSRALSANQPAHIGCAVALKSVVWDRLKSIGIEHLAKLVYNDPDADSKVIEAAKREDFWRGVVMEVDRCKKDKPLSEVVMAAFRALGIKEIHIMATDNRVEVTKSLASYFGAHITDVVKLVSNEVMSIAGRCAEDFSRPFLERVITNNPAVTNAKIRKDYMGKIIAHNVTDLKRRLSLLGEKDMVHRGDKRACRVDKHARKVELRCRLAVYQATHVIESGEAKVSESEFIAGVVKSATRVCDRINAPHSILPLEPLTFDGCLEYMAEVGVAYLDYFRACRSAMNVTSGWDAPSGQLGAKRAMELILMDSNHIVNTKYAIAPSEVAPRLYKKIIVTPAREPSVGAAPEPPAPDIDAEMEAILAELGILGQTEVVKVGEATISHKKAAYSLNIPAWKALYTLIYTQNYPVSEINEIFGVDLPENPPGSAIRDARLDEFEQEDILSVFPGLCADYTACGALFDEGWLDRDEAVAYMVDEVSSGRVGSLF